MTAERQQDTQQDPWWGEHVHRYQTAAQVIGPASGILDLACGVGFGTSILTSAITGVVHGCDLAADAVAQAQQKYGGPRTCFSIADGTRLPFQAGEFDAVVSFETLEHVNDADGLLNEFARVLKPEGRLILSTPNAAMSPAGVRNPFHVREYTAGELKQLLADRFAAVEIFGQRFTRFLEGRSGGALGKAVEAALYLRGPRKLPLSIRDRISQLFTGLPHYPRPSDYDMVAAADDVVQCKTFLAVCRK